MPRIEKSSPYRNFSRTGDTTPGVQTNGQLMGNILSFPLLCIANYCAYHIAIERYKLSQIENYAGPDENLPSRNLRVKRVMAEYPVRINGDDILFRSTGEQYDEWKNAVKSIGFNLSLGKNFAHPYFCQINSQLFRVSHDVFGEVCGTDRIHYFNFGQLTGRKKGMSSEDARMDLGSKRFAFETEEIFDRIQMERAQELSSVSRNFQDMRDNCPQNLLPVLVRLQTKWFTRRFKSLLTKEQFETVGLPVSIGGLGLDVPVHGTRRYAEDCCSSFFGKTGLEIGSQVYPEMFACSKLTPIVDLRRNKPQLPLYSVVRPKEKRNIIGDHIRERKFSLVL